MPDEVRDALRAGDDEVLVAMVLRDGEVVGVLAVLAAAVVLMVAEGPTVVVLPGEALEPLTPEEEHADNVSTASAAAVRDRRIA